MGVWRLRKVGVLLAVILLLLSCTDNTDKCPSRPECAAGALEGYLLGGDGVIEGTVRARAVSDTAGLVGSIATDVDSTGWYHLDLPGGSYVLLVEPAVEGHLRCFYSSTGLVALSRDADTLQVIEGSEPLRVDFLLGGLRVRLGLPEGLEGRRVYLSIAQEDSTLSGGWREVARNVPATVEQGIAEFVCPALPPGIYAMHLDARNSEEIWLPSARTPHEADTVTVVAGKMAAYELSLATSGARMTGEIVGSWQEMGLEHPQVFLVDADSTIVAKTQTDCFGNFIFDLLVPTRARVLAVIRCWFTRWIGGESFEEAEEFDLQLGEEISGIRLVESGLLLEAPADGILDMWRMQAEVVHADDLTPVWQFSACFLLSQTNLVPIPNLTPGDYIIRLSPIEFFSSRWLSQWYDRAESPEQATIISILQAGEVVPITLHMESGGTIQGTVTRSCGDEPEFTWICATTADSEEHLGATMLTSPRDVQSEAAFTLRGLPNGDYKIGCWVCGLYDPDCPPASVTWYPGTPNWSAATVVAIRDHEDVSGIDFEIL